MIESFQLHAIPDLLEEQKDAIDAYMTQNYRGLDSDLCACCIRNADLSSLVCTQCHGKDTKAFLEGHSLVLECQSCGYRVVGASFYSPCEQDRKPYYLWIREDRIPAAVLVKLGSMLHIGVLEMKRQIENREKLNRSLSLKEIMEEVKIPDVILHNLIGLVISIFDIDTLFSGFAGRYLFGYVGDIAFL